METAETQNTIQKGDLVYAEAIGKEVSLWFRSPTGDSSDVQINKLYCSTEAQAEYIALRHQEVWSKA